MLRAKTTRPEVSLSRRWTARSVGLGGRLRADSIRRIESARSLPPNPTLRAVQRLDKETSGLVVFARSIHAQRHLQEQFAEHTVTRRYLAIAHGKVEDGIHDSLLVPDRG